jgi:hypothetical protein
MFHHTEMKALGAVSERRFFIVVGHCRRCGREWPTHVQMCRECAAVLGEERVIRCARVVPPSVSKLVAPALAVVLALELSCRRRAGDDDWAARIWAMVEPRLADAVRVRPGRTGSIMAAWPLNGAESLERAGTLALELSGLISRARQESVELRGGIAVGAIDRTARSDAVERYAERLALTAAPGQWLVSDEPARRLEDRFVLGPAALVPRWPMPVPEVHRALAERLAPPVLPSAVRGEAPQLVLGRDAERRRLSAELAAACAGWRRIVLVTAPAGGGKSYLLRRVLADAEMTPAAGVAFPPLGSRPLDPLRHLLAQLEPERTAEPEERLGDALARAATRRARNEPTAIVIDDIHWASPQAVAALASAIAGTEVAIPLAWILSTRTAALSTVSPLVELADFTVALPPLEPADRVKLLGRRLGTVPDAVRRHVRAGPERGNPLYLEHLAEAIGEGCSDDELPRTLHEAVLARLDGLAERARQLSHWSNRSFNPGGGLQALEREVGDWLDRLETTDVADLATIGRYLARLRAVDFELVLARSLLGMPVTANRRLAWAIERLAAASTDALLDYLETVAHEGRRTQVAHEAQTAAERAERALRLGDSERLLAFAHRHDPGPELARKRGDLALALGRPHDALEAYRAAAAEGAPEGRLQRRMARAEAVIGDVDHASERLERVLDRTRIEPAAAAGAALDLARLRGLPPAAPRETLTPAMIPQAARTRAWAQAGKPGAVREVIRTLVLIGEPARCAAELIETAVLSQLAGLEVSGLDAAAEDAARALNNPLAASLLSTVDVATARRTFIHWEA